MIFHLIENCNNVEDVMSNEKVVIVKRLGRGIVDKCDEVFDVCTGIKGKCKEDKVVYSSHYKKDIINFLQERFGMSKNKSEFVVSKVWEDCIGKKVCDRVA